MLNKVQIIGHLGGDPECRSTANGTAVANFSVASSERWKDKSGEKQESTEWFKIVVWQKLAENCTEYLNKGSKVYIEGKLQTRKWEDKDGIERWSTEVVARNVIFLDSKGSGGGGRRNDEPPPMDDDDVPF